MTSGERAGTAPIQLRWIRLQEARIGPRPGGKRTIAGIGVRRVGSVHPSRASAFFSFA